MCNNQVMKKMFILLLSLTLIIVFTSSAFAQAPYVINNFDSLIYLNRDTSLTISETIETEFSFPRHGIFRDIPVIYSAKGRTIKARVDVLSVKNEQGNDHKYQTSRKGRNIQIKIGDPDSYVQGTVIYVITYRISGVVLQYEGHDEVYWNVAGSGWDTDIKKASATFVSDYAEIEDVECFSGQVGTQNTNCRMEIGQNLGTFVSGESLGSGRDMTVVVALSKDNDLVFPGPVRKLLNSAAANWGYLISVLPLVIIYTFWHKRGRDRRYIKENVYYTPDNTEEKTVALFRREYLPLVYHPLDGISPSEAGTIIDERVDIHDIVAEIVELARLGFIQIQKLEKKKIIGKEVDYAFVKTEKFEDQDSLKKYQKDILKELFRKSAILRSTKKFKEIYKNTPDYELLKEKLFKFEFVLKSSLKDHFYTGLDAIRKDLYETMEVEGYFAENPEKTRGKWLGIFFAVEIAVFVLIISFTFNTLNFGPLFVFVVLSVPGIILALSMPRRTPKGYSLYRQIKGLRWYLEKGKWRHEHAEKSMFIADVLPLAISLGVVGKIAGDLRDLGVKPPQYTGGFAASSFGSDFVRFNSSMSSTLVSSPKSSGGSGSSWSGGSGFSGGSSGGGFGGGGGGSW